MTPAAQSGEKPRLSEEDLAWQVWRASIVVDCRVRTPVWLQTLHRTISVGAESSRARKSAIATDVPEL